MHSNNFFLKHRYSEVSTRTPLHVNEMVLAAAIQQMEPETTDLEVADTDRECNENVRKMISSLQFMS